jgi:hypothetical protein
VVTALHLIVAAVDSMATILMAQETAAPTSMEGAGPMGWIEVTGDIGGEVGGTMPTLTLTTWYLNSTKAVSVEPMAIPSTTAIIKPQGASLTKQRGLPSPWGRPSADYAGSPPSR